jgi:eukaryotic-like serine/threonine-protein kinase
MFAPAEPQTGVDRNMLLAVFALQMKCVKVDALGEALGAWGIDKRQALGDILAERAHLQRDDLARLNALVNQHLPCEGGGAAGIPEAGCNAGPVRPLGAAERELAPTLRLPTDAAPAPPPAAAPAALRYRILRPHARGALGEVFIARDDELGREVALKQMQEEHVNSPTSRARFTLEAEITGGLEHPGIVAVYGLGACPDGRPYYAMRFIKGDSLHDALRRFHDADQRRRDPGQRVLELRQLLDRFVAVCNAVAYAHSRGVIHRDLKPANVMLGPYGQTLVVDWGLAKLVGRCEATGNRGEGEASLRPESARDLTPTQDGAVVGTPAYMSPEQAAGRHDDLGPASDVYSLGATLYAVLTGQPAFAGSSVPAILERVQRGDFAPLHRVKASVPRALEAVCLKAMALRPEDRYRSPQDLADDIERWLADEPVTAYREPARVRLGRWMRRHRTVVSSLAVLLMTVVAALTASVVMLSVEQGKTDEQRRQAVAQKERADAEAAALRALNDFVQRDLLGQSDIRNQPAGERDRNISVRALLDRAAARIERRFESQATTEAAICRTLGNAYRTLGEYDAAQQHLQRAA